MVRLPRLPLSAWLVASHALVALIPVAVFLGSGALTADLRQQTRWDLEHQGALLAVTARQELAHLRETAPDATIHDLDLDGLLVEAKGTTRSGIQLVDTAGFVVATSGAVLGESLADDPIVREALGGHLGAAIRPRPPQSRLQPVWTESRLANVRVFVAVPVALADEVVGAIVISRTPREELQAMWHMGSGVAWAALGALVGGGAIAAFSAWVATRSLEALQRGARRIDEGDFDGIGELTRPRQSHLVEVADTAEAVFAMTARLRERLQYIGEFAANVAHEVKTPIATLRGTLELLQDDDGSMPEAQRARFLENGARELVRLEHVMGGLLALARADASHARVVFPLQELLAEVAEEEGVTLDGAAADVSADRAQLGVALRNLVDNARKHGHAVSVRVEGFTAPDVTGFRVVDDGRGISEANLPRVFDRFFTTDRVAGTGLGLALVRAIAERHGGSVAVESEPGRTVFTVALPRADG